MSAGSLRLRQLNRWNSSPNTRVLTATLRASSSSAPVARYHGKPPKAPASTTRVTSAASHRRCRESRGSSGARGGRAMTPASAGPKARARSSATAMITLTHRICNAVIGSSVPSRMAPIRSRHSPPLVGRMNRIDFCRLSWTVRPSSTAASIEAKLSSASTMATASLATSVPRCAHGHADVRPLERRRVVDAVAGHGDDCASALQCLDEAQLLLRRDTSGHVGRQGPLHEGVVVDAGEIRAGHGRLGRHQANLAGDGACRERVVAGDHLHPDPGLPAAPRGHDRLGPRRVDHRARPE